MMAYITPDSYCDIGDGYCNYISNTTASPISHMVIIGSCIILFVQTLSIFTDDRAPAMVRILSLNFQTMHVRLKFFKIPPQEYTAGPPGCHFPHHLRGSRPILLRGIRELDRTLSGLIANPSGGPNVGRNCPSRQEHEETMI